MPPARATRVRPTRTSARNRLRLAAYRQGRLRPPLLLRIRLPPPSREHRPEYSHSGRGLDQAKSRKARFVIYHRSLLAVATPSSSGCALRCLSWRQEKGTATGRTAARGDRHRRGPDHAAHVAEVRYCIFASVSLHLLQRRGTAAALADGPRSGVGTRQALAGAACQTGRPLGSRQTAALCAEGLKRQKACGSLPAKPR